VVAEAFSKAGGKPLWIICDIQQTPELLPLLNEAIALLPTRERWRATFSTYATNIPPDADCRVRCVLSGTEAAARAPALGMVLDLTRALGPAPSHPLCVAARTGAAANSPSSPPVGTPSSVPSAAAAVSAAAASAAASSGAAASTGAPTLQLTSDHGTSPHVGLSRAESAGAVGDSGEDYALAGDASGLPQGRRLPGQPPAVAPPRLAPSQDRTHAAHAPDAGYPTSQSRRRGRGGKSRSRIALVLVLLALCLISLSAGVGITAGMLLSSRATPHDPPPAPVPPAASPAPATSTLPAPPANSSAAPAPHEDVAKRESSPQPSGLPTTTHEPGDADQPSKESTNNPPQEPGSEDGQKNMGGPDVVNSEGNTPGARVDETTESSRKVMTGDAVDLATPAAEQPDAPGSSSLEGSDRVHAAIQADVIAKDLCNGKLRVYVELPVPKDAKTIAIVKDQEDPYNASILEARKGEWRDDKGVLLADWKIRESQGTESVLVGIDVPRDQAADLGKEFKDKYELLNTQSNSIGKLVAEFNRGLKGGRGGQGIAQEKQKILRYLPKDSDLKTDKDKIFEALVSGNVSKLKSNIAEAKKSLNEVQQVVQPVPGEIANRSATTGTGSARGQGGLAATLEEIEKELDAAAVAVEAMRACVKKINEIGEVAAPFKVEFGFSVTGDDSSNSLGLSTSKAKFEVKYRPFIKGNFDPPAPNP
jgi:hypothetical protein